jgi:hypothetical protein
VFADAGAAASLLLFKQQESARPVAQHNTQPKPPSHSDNATTVRQVILAAVEAVRCTTAIIFFHGSRVEIIILVGFVA